VSVAVGLDFDGERIVDAGVALGGVAPKPWRLVEFETALRGRRLAELDLPALAAAALVGAETFEYNRFKPELARRAIVRAVRVAAGLEEA
jgi:xanthine dehydrogenase YagS FAD-binding subunit